MPVPKVNTIIHCSYLSICLLLIPFYFYLFQQLRLLTQKETNSLPRSRLLPRIHLQRETDRQERVAPAPLQTFRTRLLWLLLKGTKRNRDLVPFPPHQDPKFQSANNDRLIFPDDSSFIFKFLNSLQYDWIVRIFGSLNISIYCCDCDLDLDFDHLIFHHEISACIPINHCNL